MTEETGTTAAAPASTPFDNVNELPLAESAHSCGCDGDHQAEGVPGDAATAPAADGTPVLDARTIPHAIRHATVIGAVASRPSGASLILVAPHDPQPLLAQLEDRDDRITVDYELAGPDAWRLRLTRYDN